MSTMMTKNWAIVLLSLAVLALTMAIVLPLTVFAGSPSAKVDANGHNKNGADIVIKAQGPDFNSLTGTVHYRDSTGTLFKCTISGAMSFSADFVDFTPAGGAGCGGTVTTDLAIGTGSNPPNIGVSGLGVGATFRPSLSNNVYTTITYSHK